MAVMGGAIARQSLSVRAWASTCVYVIIFGVAFMFLVGPASAQLATTFDPSTQRMLTFVMWLVAAAILTVGALLLSYTVNVMVGRRYDDADAPQWREDVAFASRGVIFALLASGLFVGIGLIASGGITRGLIMAALLAFVIPGALAGALTHTVIPTVVAETKQLVTASGFAVAVVVVANYVLVGTVEPLMTLAGQ